MKKKWIIPAIIAVVLVVIVSLIAFFPAMLINGMAKEQVKRLDNSYINSNYQGWNEVTFFDEHHFLLPDTWHIESISDATYCIYGDDARVSPLLESWERTRHIEIRMHSVLRCSRAWKLFRARNYTSENTSGTVAMHIR